MYLQRHERYWSKSKRFSDITSQKDLEATRTIIKQIPPGAYAMIRHLQFSISARMSWTSRLMIVTRVMIHPSGVWKAEFNYPTQPLVTKYKAVAYRNMAPAFFWTTQAHACISRAVTIDMQNQALLMLDELNRCAADFADPASWFDEA